MDILRVTWLLYFCFYFIYWWLYLEIYISWKERVIQLIIHRPNLIGYYQHTARKQPPSYQNMHFHGKIQMAKSTNKRVRCRHPSLTEAKSNTSLELVRRRATWNAWSFSFIIIMYFQLKVPFFFLFLLRTWKSASHLNLSPFWPLDSKCVYGFFQAC